jgi:hypothetical protein
VSDTLCDKDRVYFVFHGTSRSRRPQDWVYPSTGVARTTVVGHGDTQSAAFDDAKRHELERGPGGYDFSGIGHVSGPHRPVRRVVPA